MMKVVKIMGIVLAAGAIIGIAYRYAGRSAASRRPAMMRGDATVIVEPVGTRPFATRIEAIGTAYARESVDITATVAERVARIGFENGAAVKTGDLLVQLEDAEERAAVEEAGVSLAEQRRELERVRALREKQMAPQQELDNRQSAMEMAAARAAAAQVRLRDRSITAPFAGVLGLRRVSPGALVTPGTVITTLDDVEVIKARFAVPESALSGIATGQTIEAGCVALPDMTFTGTVAAIDSRVEPATRAVTVEAHIPNPGARLRPGMLLTVTLISRPRTAIAVPEKALVASADRHFVFVARPDGTVERRELHLGERDVGWAEITSGLQPGESIVVEGQMDLKDGSRVQLAGPSLKPGT
jgi:membrane fusion protein (multidrug efflux system)